jgi:16S rRNA (cytidine1402-2'-O)-methyltransferase
LPGATAFVPALVNSGLPNDKFIFEGFLPVKKGRQTRLTLLAAEPRTMIFYESPHKLLKTLQDFCTYFGPERSLSVSREITKLFEETIRGTAQEVLDHYTAQPAKGEIVIVVGGKPNLKASKK